MMHVLFSKRLFQVLQAIGGCPVKLAGQLMWSDSVTPKDSRALHQATSARADENVYLLSLDIDTAAIWERAPTAGNSPNL
jgi:hypothetical protein